MIVLIVGDFCVGKDTFADMLMEEIYEYSSHKVKKILSYTTRPARYKERGTHEFCTREEFLEFDDLIAQTKIDDEYYGARASQFDIDGINIYVVDTKGASDVVAYGLDDVYIIEIVRPVWLIKCSQKRQNRMRYYSSSVPVVIDYRVMNDAGLNKLHRESVECAYRIIERFESD